MDEIIEEFKEESSQLVQNLIEILENAEDNPGSSEKLEEYGQKVDRIMGSAKTMVMTSDEPGEFEMIGQYAELCKSIGYKGSQIQNNESLYNVTVGLLFDATESLEGLINKIGQKSSFSKDEVMSQPFLERLKWLSTQFDDSYRSSLKLGSEEAGPEKVQIKSIDDILESFFKS